MNFNRNTYPKQVLRRCTITLQWY